MPAPAPTVEGWTAKLQDGGLEVFLKAPDRKIRASGPEAEMLELIDWFEEKTGLRVTVPNRPRTGPRPIEGQVGLDLNTELESGEPDA